MFRNAFLLCAMCAWLWISGEVSAKEPIRVACLGDSITEGAGLKQPWPAVLQQKLGNGYQVKNFGVGAATLLSGGLKPYARQQEHKDAVAFKPQIVIVMLGVNDSTAASAPNLKSFSTDFESLIEPFQKRRARLFACTPAQVQKGAWGINEITVAKTIVPAVRAAAKQSKTRVIEVHKAFEDLPGQYWLDGVHLNQTGSDLVAETVHEVLKPAADRKTKNARKSQRKSSPPTEANP